MDNNQKKRSSLPAILGSVLAITCIVCAVACILALTYKFVLWIVGV